MELQTTYLNEHSAFEQKYQEGPDDAKICFIGEAPGEQEVRQGRPFVGRAGFLFDQLLARAGILRRQCKIDNVFTFRPGDMLAKEKGHRKLSAENLNDVSPFISFRKSGPVPTPAFIQQVCALEERLSHYSANILVPLGNTALFALTGLAQVTKRRGSILRANNGRKVIPTIHPSAANQQYSFQNFIVQDLKRIAREAEFSDIRLRERELILEPSYLEAMEFIDLCHKKDMVAFDIEVSHNEISHVSLATDPEFAICIPFYDAGQNYFSLEHEAEVWKWLSDLLEDKNVVKVGQNIIFDSTFVFRKYGIIVEPIDDTMIAQSIAFPAYPKGLDFIVASYCGGEPYYKDEGKKWFKNPFGDKLSFRRYSAMDSAVCIEAFPAIMKVVKHLHNEETYERQKRLVKPLTYMSERGILIDVEGLEMESVRASREIRKLQAELDEIVGYPINIASPKQVKEYFYKNKKIKPYVTKGRPTVDEKALIRIAAKGYKEANIILKLRHIKKMKGTYFDMQIDDDNRMRCSFNPVGTLQGRPSSSKNLFGTGGNMLNQPPAMKKLMLADPGMLMVSIDLAQAENRCVAYMSNEQRMIYAFEHGIDIHRQTAGLIFGKKIEDVSDEDGSCYLGGGLYSERFWGKKANHGLNYSLGPGTFALSYQISLNEARFMVNSYHAQYPSIRLWHAGIRERLAKGRTLVNCFGRCRRFTERWGDDLFRSAYSFNPQSTIADQCNKYGICAIYYEEKFKELDILNSIYDSVLFQVPLRLGADHIFELLLGVVENLETKICWQDREFIVPADITIGLTAKGDIEFKSKEVHNESDKVIKSIQGYIDTGGNSVE